MGNTMASKRPLPSGQPLSGTLSQEDVLKILEDRTLAAQRQLAGRPDAAPEVLLYLAARGRTAVRRMVAANNATPPHANRLLADDEDDEVRAQLARKIGRLLPDLSAAENARLRELTIETMERLATDQLPRVRAALAEEIKALDCVPPHLVQALARDAEAIVAAPILEYSPLLSDSDLLEIVATAKVAEALAAIARRKSVSANVSDAIVTALDIPAIAALLANPDAKIRDETLQKVLDTAESIKDWHKPLVLRLDLSQRAVRRIASFVGSSLLDQLSARHSLDEDTSLYLGRQLRSRLDEEASTQSEEEMAHERVQAARSTGQLDDAFVSKAAEAGQREDVLLALAELAQIPREVVSKILQSGSARPLTALAWYAGLSMRAAFKIQRFVQKLPASQLLPARQGIHFPLSEKEMRWHLGYFGIPT